MSASFSKVDLIAIILLMQAGFMLFGVPAYVLTRFKYGGVSGNMAQTIISYALFLEQR